MTDMMYIWYALHIYIYIVPLCCKLKFDLGNVVVEQVVSMMIKQQPSRQVSLKRYQFGRDHPARARPRCYFISCA